MIPKLTEIRGSWRRGRCEPIEMTVELRGQNQVPFLSVIPFRAIILSAPGSDLYVGTHTGLLTYWNEHGDAMHQTEFDVEIVDALFFAPYFVRFNPLNDEEEEREELPTWFVEPGVTATYELPRMKDLNKYDVIRASLQYSDSTSEALASCECIEIIKLSPNEMKLELNYPVKYTSSIDEVVIELNDGRLTNLYAIKIVISMTQPDELDPVGVEVLKET